MRDSKNSKGQSFFEQSMEVSTVAPKVISHRLNEFLKVGLHHTPETQQEYILMWEEKVMAYTKSWLATSEQAIKINQQMTETLIQNMFTPWWNVSMMNYITPSTLAVATQSILDKGIEPIHKQTISNSKRISRLK